MSTLTIRPVSRPDVRETTISVAWIVGFSLVFRTCLTLLFFRSDAAIGAAVVIAIDLALLYWALIASDLSHWPVSPAIWRIPAIRWLSAFLLFSLLSVGWTGARSAATALVYWVGMFADVATVLVVMNRRGGRDGLEGLLKGAVCGAAGLAVVAWCTPTTADMRLGDEVFLHPNTLGLELGVASLLAQYLFPLGKRWRWAFGFLAITLLRTLSKTAIIAFVFAEAWYLWRHKAMGRKVKLQIGLAAAVVVGCFWSLLSSYLEVYNNLGSGNQIETLTGRTVLWATAGSMALETPWLGHGLYSLRSLMPAFGAFEPWHAHNDLLQQFFEFGCIGVMIAIGLHWTFYRQARRSQATGLRTLALSLLIFAFIHGLADTVPFGFSFPLWLLAGLSASLDPGRPMEGLRV